MPVFYYLPKAAIAAIVIVAAFRLIEFHLHVLWAVSFPFSLLSLPPSPPLPHRDVLFEAK